MAYCFINASSHIQHSEAKHTDMSEIGADKGLLEGHGGKLVVHALKRKKIIKPTPWTGFGKTLFFFFKEKIIANETTDKGLISTIYKPLNTRKINNPIKNKQKT